MIALFVTVLLASLVGSLHCAGMCGAFVAFAIGAGDPGAGHSRRMLLGLYQVGRLATYVVLGAIAGTIGSAIDVGGQSLGLKSTAAILSGALMVGFGVVTLARLGGVKLTALKVPRSLSKLISTCHRHAMRYSPPVRALATGLLTTLLPCGWLYGFVALAAGTGHAWSGAVLMACFWAGTLPVLTIVGVGVRALAAPLAAKLPAITASVIVLVGVYTIVARASISLRGAAAGTGDPAELSRQAGAMDSSKAPCCVNKTGEPTSAPATTSASAPTSDAGGGEAKP